MRAVDADLDTALAFPKSTWGRKKEGREEKVRRLILKFMEHGLLWAILVWAGAVALMAINTPDPFWRWTFLGLSATGVVIVVVINWARKKLVSATQPKDGSQL
jgi:hypothetical protein